MSRSRSGSLPPEARSVPATSISVSTGGRRPSVLTALGLSGGPIGMATAGSSLSVADDKVVSIVAALQAEKKRLVAEVRDLTRSKDELARTNQGLARSVDELSRRCDEVAHERSDALKELQALRSKSTATSRGQLEELRTLRSQVAVLEEQVAAATEESANAKRDAKRATLGQRDRTIRLQESVAALTSDVTRLTGEKEDVARRLLTLQGVHDKLRESTARTEATMQARIEILEAQIARERSDTARRIALQNLDRIAALSVMRVRHGALHQWRSSAIASLCESTGAVGLLATQEGSEQPRVASTLHILRHAMHAQRQAESASHALQRAEERETELAQALAAVTQHARDADADLLSLRNEHMRSEGERAVAVKKVEALQTQLNALLRRAIHTLQPDTRLHDVDDTAAHVPPAAMKRIMAAAMAVEDANTRIARLDAELNAAAAATASARADAESWRNSCQAHISAETKLTEALGMEEARRNALMSALRRLRVLHASDVDAAVMVAQSDGMAPRDDVTSDDRAHQATLIRGMSLLQSRLAAASVELREADEREKRLRMERTRLLADIDGYRAAQSVYESTAAGMRDAVAAVEATNAVLTAQNDSKESMLTALRERLQTLTETMHMKLSNMDSLQASANDATSACNRWKSECNRVTAQLAAATALCERRDDELAAARAALLTASDASDARVQPLLQREAEMRVEIDVVAQKLEQVTQEKIALESAVQELHGRVSLLQNECNQLQQAYDAAQASIDAEKAACAAQIGDMQTKTAQVQAQCERDALALRAAVEEDRAARTAEVALMRESSEHTLVRLRRELQDEHFETEQRLRDDVARLTAEAATSKSALEAQHAAAVKAWTDDAERMKTQLQKAKELIRQMETVLMSQSASMASAEQALQAREREVERVREELDLHASAARHWQERVRALEAAASENSPEMRLALQAEMNALRGFKAAADEKLAAGLERLQARDAKIQLLSEQLTALRGGAPLPDLATLFGDTRMTAAGGSMSASLVTRATADVPAEALTAHSPSPAALTPPRLTGPPNTALDGISSANVASLFLGEDLPALATMKQQLSAAHSRIEQLVADNARLTSINAAHVEAVTALKSDVETATAEAAKLTAAASEAQERITCLTVSVNDLQQMNTVMSKKLSQVSLQAALASRRLLVVAGILAPRLHAVVRAAAEGNGVSSPRSPRSMNDTHVWEVSLLAVEVHEVVRVLTLALRGADGGSGSSGTSDAHVSDVESETAHLLYFVTAMASKTAGRVLFRPGEAGSSVDGGATYSIAELEAISEMRLQLEAAEKELGARAEEIDILNVRADALAGDLEHVLAECLRLTEELVVKGTDLRELHARVRVVEDVLADRDAQLAGLAALFGEITARNTAVPAAATASMEAALKRAASSPAAVTQAADARIHAQALALLDAELRRGGSTSRLEGVSALTALAESSLEEFNRADDSSARSTPHASVETAADARARMAQPARMAAEARDAASKRAMLAAAETPTRDASSSAPARPRSSSLDAGSTSSTTVARRAGQRATHTASSQGSDVFRRTPIPPRPARADSDSPRSQVSSLSSQHTPSSAGLAQSSPHDEVRREGGSSPTNGHPAADASISVYRFATPLDNRNRGDSTGTPVVDSNASTPAIQPPPDGDVRLGRRSA